MTATEGFKSATPDIAEMKVVEAWRDASPDDQDTVAKLVETMRSSRDDGISRKRYSQISNGSSEPKAKGPSFFRLVQLSKPEWPALSRAVFISFICIGADLMAPEFGKIMDNVIVYPLLDKEDIYGIVDVDISDDKSYELRKWILYTLLSRMISFVFGVMKAITFGLVAERVVVRMRTRLFHAILYQDMNFFDSRTSGELSSRLGPDAMSVQMVATTGVPDLILCTIKIILATVMMFLQSWKLGLMIVALIPAVFLYMLPFLHFVVRKLNTEYQDAMAVSSDIATQSIGNVRLVRCSGAEPFAYALYAVAVGDPKIPGACCWWPRKAKSIYRIGALKAVSQNLMTQGSVAIFFTGLTLITWYGYDLIIMGKLTMGKFGAWITYALMIGFQSGILAKKLHEVYEGMGASQRIFEIIDRTPAIPAAGGQVPSNLRGDVALENVKFAYPSRSDVQVLSGISLQVPAKSKAALVGSSGAGKSTVLALLERLYDVTEGRVLIDGHDVRELDVRWLRRRISVVQQEPVLFGFSIRENIRFGRTAAGVSEQSPEETEEEVLAAAAQANAHDFIVGFPEGYDTLVGERGVRLSGGQKQRVAIARSILCDPPIMLLDEATSALDSESEHLVQEALDRLMKNRTTIIVAHRLSTVVNADQIIVMASEGIIDSGKHEQLLGRCETYKELVKRQMMDIDSDFQDVPSAAHGADLPTSPTVISINGAMSACEKDKVLEAIAHGADLPTSPTVISINGAMSACEKDKVLKAIPHGADPPTSPTVISINGAMSACEKDKVLEAIKPGAPGTIDPSSARATRALDERELEKMLAMDESSAITSKDKDKKGKKGKNEEKDEDGAEDIKSDPPVAKKGMYGFCWRLIKPEFTIQVLTLICTLSATFVEVHNPRWEGEVINIIIADTSVEYKQEETRRIMRLLVICNVGIHVVHGFRLTISAMAGERIVARLRLQLFSAIFAQEIGFFDTQTSGALTSRMTTDTLMVQKAAESAFMECCLGLVKTIACVIMAFSVSWELALLTLAIGPVVALTIVLPVCRLMKLEVKYNDALARATQVATETTGSMRTVISFGAEELMEMLYSTSVGKLDGSDVVCWWPTRANSIYRFGAQRGVIFRVTVQVAIWVALSCLTCILWYAYHLILGGRLTFGEVHQFSLYGLQIGQGLTATMGAVGIVAAARAALERIFEIYSRPTAIANHGGERPTDMQSEICFEDVRFAYPSRPDAQVLDGLSFIVPANSSAAFVGSSGAGKSTVLAMLLRFYEADAGKISIGGHDIKSLDASWSRRRIGIVQQEPVLFGFNVRENIAYGRNVARVIEGGPPVTDVEIQRAAEMANAHDFIRKLPEQYQTLVGERGVLLSGGQKQRVAVARALLIEPPILLLDEATSALDAESEHLVQEAIQKAMKHRTVLIVAHRLSTIRDVDRIHMLADGKLVDSGKHQELFDRCERYQELVKHQV